MARKPFYVRTLQRNAVMASCSEGVRAREGSAV